MDIGPRTKGMAAIGLLLAVSALVLGLDPDHAPIPVALVLLSSIWVWSLAWKAAGGTALKPALVWAGLALVFAIIAQIVGWGEPLASGRPGAGRLTYLAALAVLAALVSVLNARAPGERVWAGLMALLVVVFLIPWLEAPGRLRQAQGLATLQLDSPWTIFYGLLVLIGVTNYLPTRYGFAAVWLAVGLILEYVGLTRVVWPAARRASLWPWVAWAIGASLWVARWNARQVPSARSALERLWFWFRDHWGVVWALRIQERFNRTAELKRWPVRLGWFGLHPVDPNPTDAPVLAPVEAEETLRGLLRRFARPERLDRVLNPSLDSSCDGTDGGR